MMRPEAEGKQSRELVPRAPRDGRGRRLWPHREREGGFLVEEPQHLACHDVLPAGRVGLALRLDRSRAHRRAVARARPRARSDAAPGTRASAPGRPPRGSVPRSARRAGRRSLPSTSSTPKRPRASAVAIGQTRLYCISSVFVGRRRERSSAAANVRTTTDSMRVGSGRRRSAASMPGCDQRQHG